MRNVLFCHFPLYFCAILLARAQQHLHSVFAPARCNLLELSISHECSSFCWQFDGGMSYMLLMECIFAWLSGNFLVLFAVTWKQQT